MRRVLPDVFFVAALFVSLSLQAQNDHFAYVITDVAKDGAGWNALRKLDLETGRYSDVLVNGTDGKMAAYDAVTKKQLSQQPDAKWGNLLQAPFGTGVAAAAYDRKHNRLYYTPMFVDQLRYIDLKTMQVFYVTGHSFSGAGNMHNNESKIITRMVIAPDGYGYAINNDGTSLIRFSTGKKPAIEQLGILADDVANSVSIHNKPNSFGGDMISDDNGNLYILTARYHVFKVNVESKVATHVGVIQNLPTNFTVNGAVVDGDGNLLVSSAVDGSGYYTVNPKDWKANLFSGANSVYRSSDLANSNFLATAAKNDFAIITRPEEKFANLISVYPNPVIDSRIAVQFNKVPNGDYTVELTDVLGRGVMQRKFAIGQEKQLQVLPLNGSNAKGVYMIKVYDAAKQSVFTQKVVVQ